MRRGAGILSSRGSLSKSERNLQNKFLKGLWLRDEPSGPLTMNIRVRDAIGAGSAEPAPQFRLLALLESRVRNTQRNHLCTAVEDGPMLAWLARYGGPATRFAVAANRAAPVAVDLVLSRDEDPSIRAEIARKLARSLARNERLNPPACRDALVAGVERLAEDGDPHVRAALAHEIRYLGEVPYHVAWALAANCDPAVSGPILQCSPLLAESDLLAIIRAGASGERLAAIARRKPLSADFCDAFVIHVDPRAIAVLIANPDAKIRRETLDHIAQRSGAAAWCVEALSMRADLSAQSVRAIARIAGRRSVERMAQRFHDEETRRALDQELGARLEEVDRPPPETSENVAMSVREANEDGRIDNVFIKTAADRGNMDVVVTTIAERAGLSRGVVRRLLLSGTSSAVVALVRGAGFDIRAAYRILEMATVCPHRTCRDSRARPPRDLRFS